MFVINQARNILAITLLFLVCIPAYSQTGPGGVGNSTSNILWLKANEITGLVSGADVQTWTDASGNSNTLTQPDALVSPVYQTNVLNGLPVVRFNKTNNRIRKGSFAGVSASNMTAIYVNKTSDSNDATISYASTVDSNDFLLFKSENLTLYRATGNLASGVSFNNNTFHITNAAWRSSDGRVELWKNGVQSFTSTGFRTGSSIGTNGTLALAGEQDVEDGDYQATQAHSGDFAEVIMFNTFLNTAQQIIVSNYLAAKYNLTITNNRYAYRSTHPNAVAGIGREDVSNTHTSAMSANILRVENPSGLNVNQEYLLFGHNNADATTAWTTTEAPNGGTDIQRLAREWRLDETGDVGKVDFIINTAAMPATPLNHTMYALMVDADGDFSSGASVYEMSLLAGSEYKVSGVEISDGDYVAIAAVRPTVQHSITSSSGAEDVNASITVELNFIPSTNKTVEVTTSDVTATAGSDYTALVASTVTIMIGTTTTNYTVNITDDAVGESNESFIATLANPSAGLNLGVNTVHTYTIIDNDISRKVYFDLASSSNSETVTSANINLSISEVDNVNPTTVDYAVTGGTATGGGVDYTLASGTVTFPPSVTTGFFTISINNDVLFEANETIIITLSNPTNSNLDNTVPYAGTGFVSHTYTINNDDTAPTIQFSTTSSSGSETVPTVNFQVALNKVSGVAASAAFTVTGTATGGGVDYTLANGTVTIPAGSTTANITATIVNDNLEELSETIIITLSAPSNATLGANTVHTYTIINNSVTGYTGPGGVGQASSNKLWLRSEDLALVADGTDITTWTDFSGNGNHLVQANTSFTPRFYNNITNGQAVARFNQANGRIVKTNFSNFPTNEITTFHVNRTTDSGDGVLSYASSASDNDYLLYSSNNLAVYRGSTNITSGVSFNNNVFNIATTTWQSSNGATTVWKNGKEEYTTTGFRTGTSIATGGTFALAGEQDGINSGYDAAQDHLGDFAEVAVYNLRLNTTQIIIVQNYLAAKYGLNLLTNKVYTQDGGTSGNYDFEVAGIGRISDSNFHADAKGSGIVRINEARDLDNEEFLMWGHDNGSLKATNITDIPVGVAARFERVWRVSEVNRSFAEVDVGGVDISFDLTGLGSVTASDLVLLVDADGVFATDAMEVSGAIHDGGNVYRFSNVSQLSNNMRFTLGTKNMNQTPLPVDLLSFTASAISNNKVALKWATTSETNHSHFVIERTTDGNNFELIDIVPGTGNSEHRINYNYVDQAPLTGRSFYRLKIVDFSGEFEYSELVEIKLLPERHPSKFKVYPNPLTDDQVLKIEYQISDVQSIYINVFNMKGELILGHEKSLEAEHGIIEFSKAALPKGVLLVRISTTEGEHWSYKLMVN
ncbi:Calx-beta domain-containing protein [Roseivirga echinicomitans]